MDEDVDDIGRKHFKTLTLDVEYYQSFLDDVDIAEDKRKELIETLWQIVVSFVDVGFGIHPLQQTDTNSDKHLHPSVLKMITEVAKEPIRPNQLKEAWPEENQL